MFTTILVPIDITHPERVKSTIDTARRLTPGGKLILLHVVEPLPGYVLTEMEGLRHTMTERATAETKEIAAALDLPATSQILVREGHVYHTILSVAQEVSADLIVIASHDPVITDYLLGSVAARVVRHAHCSVLVLRDAAGHS